MKSPSDTPFEKSDPLFEKLGSYIDQELPAPLRAEVENLLSGSPENRQLLADLKSINELGDYIHESMPNDAYFEDLPSRILHRIQMEEAAEARPRVEPKKAHFFDRLFSPTQRWRWATATATIGAVGIGAWFATQTDPGHSIATVPTSMNEVVATADDNPNDQYVARVAETLGGYGNLGFTLDQGSPIHQVIEPSGQSILQTVSFQDLSVPSEDMQALPGQGATVEECFSVARLCEENGKPALASRGYRLVFNSKASQDDLFLAAHLGYIRSMWRDRIQRNPETADQLYSLLTAEANQGFLEHEEGNHEHCARFWAVTTAAQQLGMKHFSTETLTELSRHAGELKQCAKYRAAQRP